VSDLALQRTGIVRSLAKYRYVHAHVHINTHTHTHVKHSR